MNTNKLMNIIDEFYEKTGIPCFETSEDIIEFLSDKSNESEYRIKTFSQNVDINELNKTIEFMFGLC